MVKKTVRPRVVVKPKVRVSMKRKAGPSVPVFGPVSTIDTAPVSIGNTITGASPVIVPVEDGVRVQGRDFLLNIYATGAAITDWTLTAGAPITPACMVASTLKHFSSTYAHYCVHGVAFHYITSSSTATNGSIMFYINKDRAGPALPTDSANFMPAVLSDHNTTIGPLWKNLTSSYFPEPRWFPTDVLNNEDSAVQSPGEILVYTKSASAEVPGYILVDYDITFRGLSLNPKSMVLPVSRMKYTQVNLRATGTFTSGTTVAGFTVDVGTLLDGQTTSAAPTGMVAGDVYKIILDVNDANLGAYSAANLLIKNVTSAIQVAETVTDGFTCYAVAGSTTTIYLYPTIVGAKSGSDVPYFFGSTQTTTVLLPAFMSLIGTIGGTMSQASL